MIVNCSELRSQFKVAITDDDHVLLPLLKAAEEKAKRYCGTVLEAEDVTEYRDGDGTDVLLLKNYPVNSVASVYDDVDRTYAAASLIAAADYMFESSGRLILDALVFNIGRQNVKVTYNAGYTATAMPYDLKKAIANIAFADYLEANGSINMVEGDEFVYRPKKLRDEAFTILDLFRKMV